MNAPQPLGSILGDPNKEWTESLKLGKHWNELMDVEAKKIPAEYQSPVVAGAELERYGMRKGSNAHPVLDESDPAIKLLLAPAQMGNSGAHVSPHY